MNCFQMNEMVRIGYRKEVFYAHEVLVDNFEEPKLIIKFIKKKADGTYNKGF
ncbi:hypothetical protein AB4Z22_36410 [Paenibacillus sp. TAF58]